MSAGKGFRGGRPVNLKTYGDNFESIDWKSSKPKREIPLDKLCESSESTNRTSDDGRIRR